MSSRAPISLIVLTYNEEANIEHTLESARDLVEETIIVDSFSTDRTLEICRRYTDRVYQHPFENQAKQFNWAIDNLEIAGEWVLRLDSDEMLTPELKDEYRLSLPTLPKDVTGIYMKRRVFFMGRWIRHGDYYPMWFLRTFRKGKGRYEEITEEHIVLNEGRSVRFRHDFIDYNRKGLSFWVDKHNHWAVGEMLDTLGMMGRGALPEGTVRPSLFGAQEQRRRWLKRNVYVRVPLLVRPFAYFLYRYFLKLGFLDGKEGLIFHFLQGCFYRFLVDAKIYEALKMGIDRAQLQRQYSGSKPWEELVRSDDASSPSSAAATTRQTGA
jgi:glycosyltransferase involved in cell wall biosynthesis